MEVTDVLNPQVGKTPAYVAKVAENAPYEIVTSYSGDIVTSGSDNNRRHAQNGVYWWDFTEGRFIKDTEKFLPDHEYVVYVALQAKPGYRFAHQAGQADKPDVKASIDGGNAKAEALVKGPTTASRYPATDKISVSYFYPAVQANQIKTLRITGIDDPIVGQRPDYTFILNTLNAHPMSELGGKNQNFKVKNGISWMELSSDGRMRLMDPANETDVFRADCRYVVLVHLKADDYSSFVCKTVGKETDYSMTVSINGNTANTSVSQMCQIEADAGLIPGFTQSSYARDRYVTVSRSYNEGNSYTISVENGEARARAFGTEITTAAANSLVYLVPNSVAGETFSHWEIIDGNLTSDDILATRATSATTSMSCYYFTMPKSPVALRAVYLKDATAAAIAMSGYQVGATTADLNVTLQSESVELVSYDLHGTTSAGLPATTPTGQPVKSGQTYWLRVEVSGKLGFDVSKLSCENVVLNGNQKADMTATVSGAENRAAFYFELPVDVFGTTITMTQTGSGCLVQVENLPENLQGTVVVAQYSSAGQMKAVQMLVVNGDRTVKFTGFVHAAGDVYQAFLLEKDRWAPLCTSAKNG